MRNIGPFGLENRIFAGICGLAALVLSMLLFGWGFFGALIFGVIVGIAVLVWLLMQISSNDTAMGGTATTTSAQTPMSASTPTASTGSSASTGTDATVAAASADTNDAATATKEATSEAATTDSAAADATGAGTTGSADASADMTIKPSATLAGEDELAARKGEWKYDGAAADTTDATPVAAAPKKAAPKKAAPKKAAARKPAAKKPAPAKAAQSDSADKDYDGDGVIEGTNEGSRPATLTAARDGGADDLKQIKGVGPKMETMLHGMGFFHFDQVAAWSGDEVAWVDANLKGFKGRVSRDNWVDQAKTLAAGGETAFSKKVEKGGVY
jgi:predicted flap endonuclease-1-like 5' DNA nuclease